jgi:glycerol-3-phosphate dehydrogenase
VSAPAAPALDSGYRAAAWTRLERGVDVLVVGGGVTGAGVALDASLRGLTVGLVEQRDFAAGTSSRSSKLVHGGLRYLEQLNFSLVREALRERTLLLETLAPHLVRPLPFLLPLRHRVWERPYIGAGLTLYDTLGGLSPAVPRHSHLSKAATLKACPSLRPDNLAGSIRYHDAQVDDARLTVELVRTAAAYGAAVLSAARVVSFRHEGLDPRVRGARVLDAETGHQHDVPARVVVNACGVWSGQVEALSGVAEPVRMRPSKGVHLVVPRDRIDSSTALISRTKTSVLFVLPWGNTWIIGTTDTPWHHEYAHPAATAKDVGYLLGEANKILSSDLAESDVMGLYAGLRPLIDHSGMSESALSPRAPGPPAGARARHRDRRQVHDVPGDGRRRRRRDGRGPRSPAGQHHRAGAAARCGDALGRGGRHQHPPRCRAAVRGGPDPPGAALRHAAVRGAGPRRR